MRSHTSGASATSGAAAGSSMLVGNLQQQRPAAAQRQLEPACVWRLRKRQQVQQAGLQLS
jgi:hypothetical protein